MNHIIIGDWHVYLVPDHQVLVRFGAGAEVPIVAFNDLPVVVRNHLRATGMASIVESHLACAVS